MKKKKIVISDWGGVVESHNDIYSVFDAQIDLIKTYTNEYDDEEILKKFDKCSYNKNGIKIGVLGSINDIYEWIDRINNSFKINVSYDEFIDNYVKMYDSIYSYQDVVKYIKSIKGQCEIGILSNLTLLDKVRIDKQMGLSDFNHVFLSYEMGNRKPNDRVYLNVQGTLDIVPENILLIDDTKENIEAARKNGWKTCMATGKELDKIKKEVNEFLKS